MSDGIEVEYNDRIRRWLVVQRLTAEDARTVGYALGERDGAAKALFAAADEADRLNS